MTCTGQIIYCLSSKPRGPLVTPSFPTKKNSQKTKLPIQWIWESLRYSYYIVDQGDLCLWGEMVRRKWEHSLLPNFVVWLRYQGLPNHIQIRADDRYGFASWWGKGWHILIWSTHTRLSDFEPVKGLANPDGGDWWSRRRKEWRRRRKRWSRRRAFPNWFPCGICAGAALRLGEIWFNSKMQKETPRMSVPPKMPPKRRSLAKTGLKNGLKFEICGSLVGAMCGGVLAEEKSGRFWKGTKPQQSQTTARQDVAPTRHHHQSSSSSPSSSP